ncbi:UNVERIFIED_ORG: molecular chaperone IbpA [Rhizobium nepotum]|nr:molecular chaperone IbpA [Rhizobium nepotum]
MSRRAAPQWRFQVVPRLGQKSCFPGRISAWLEAFDRAVPEPYLIRVRKQISFASPLDFENTKNQIVSRQSLMTGLAVLEAPLLALWYPCCFKEDMVMATSYDYAPLYRSSIGFDRVFNLLENAQRTRSISDWPPYDIIRTAEDSYQISIAVAGFTRDEIDITFQSNLLTVTGKRQETPAEGYLHRGIAARPFEHRFELADHVRVSGAELKNGLLSIDLVREIPEALKPRKIDIQTDAVLVPTVAPGQIEAQKAA